MTNAEASKIFDNNKIKYLNFNNGLHMRIVLTQIQMDGHIDFWPTREKWIYGEESNTGIRLLIHYIEGLNKKQERAEKQGMKYLTPDRIFEVAKGSKDKSLSGICKEIHRAIYK